jgi:hypothetical protein
MREGKRLYRASVLGTVIAATALLAGGTAALAATVLGTGTYDYSCTAGDAMTITSINSNEAGIDCATTTTAPTTTSTGPTTTTTSGPPSAITAVGSLAATSIPAGGSPLLSVDPQAVGDLLVLGLEDSNSTPPTYSSVSGGGVTTWTLLARDNDPGNVADNLEIWDGVVTTPGPSTIEATLTGFSNGDDMLAQEFSDGSGTWASDSGGKIADTLNQDFDYPSLTPGGSGELYFGIGTAVNSTTLGGNGTPDVTYVETGLNCVSLAVYDTGTSATLAPAVQSEGGSGNWSTAVAVLVES